MTFKTFKQALRGVEHSKELKQMSKDERFLYLLIAYHSDSNGIIKLKDEDELIDLSPMFAKKLPGLLKRANKERLLTKVMPGKWLTETAER